MHDPPEGDALLDGIEESLRRSLEQAVVPPEPEGPASTPPAEAPPPRWQDCLDRADAVAAGADEPLAAAQGGFAEWVGRVQAARARLGKLLTP